MKVDPKRAALVARLIAIAAVLAAPLSPAVRCSDTRSSVVFVVDRSLSVSDQDLTRAEEFIREALARRGNGAAFGSVVFGSDAELVVEPRETIEPDRTLVPRRPSLVRALGSDIAGALRLAAATLPEAGERRIVLLSDGRTTRGDPELEARRARELGIEVDSVPMKGATPDKPTITDVTIDKARVAQGEPIIAEALVRGPPGGRVGVKWSRDARVLKGDDVILDGSGYGRAVLTDTEVPAGAHVYQAETWNSEAVASSAAQALGVVAGTPRVLVVGSPAQAPTLLVEALKGADAEIGVARIGEEELDAARLFDADLVVLNDVPIARRGEVTLGGGISEATQQALIQYVSERGGGLLVLGGAFGFSPDYADAPIAKMLPVEIESRGEIEDPPVALAVILDRSGSMGVQVGTQTKLSLAIEAAVAAASALRPGDRVAIAAVDTQSEWLYALGAVSALSGALGRVRAIEGGGGGIYVYTALSDAYTALSGAREPVKHVILLSDAADSEEQHRSCPDEPCDSADSAVDLARSARKLGITTTVVGIGEASDQHVGFLQSLAASAGGRFYLSGRATDLRRIFVSETRARSRSNLREEKTRLVAGDPHPVLAGIDSAALPPVDGFVMTRRRSTAATALLAQGRPLLALWRYGLGSVAALTTDAGGRWTETWAGSAGAGQLMRQLARFAMRPSTPARLELSLALSDRSTELVVEGTDDERAEPAVAELFAVAEDGKQRALDTKLERSAPARHHARATTRGERFVIARVRDSSGRLLGEAFARSDAALELTGTGPDRRLLAAVAHAGGGVFDPKPSETLRPAAERAPRLHVTWPWLLVAAGAFVALDLWLRRLGRPERRDLEEMCAAGQVSVRQA